MYGWDVAWTKSVENTFNIYFDMTHFGKMGSLGETRRQQSAPRSREAHLAPAALADDLGEQG